MSATDDVMTDGVITVRLVGLPVPIHVRASEHMEALSREFQIIRRSNPSTDSVPERLHALVEALDGQFAAFTAQPMDQLRLAIEADDPSVDLEFHLPGTAGDAAARLRALLDEADVYCRAGQHLLTLATPSDAVAYRRWFLDEFTHQVAGRPPVPWAARSQSDEGEGEEEAVIGFANDTATEELPEGWSVDRHADSVTIHLAGELDLQLAPSLRDLLTRFGDGLDAVTVDLREVSFLDSVGISVLIAAYQRLHESEVAFSLLSPPRVHRTLTIAGVAEVLGSRPPDDSS